MTGLDRRGGEQAWPAPILRSALILDDEADRRAWMRDGLLEHGIRCVETATVQEAIGRLAGATFDLFVCDMVLSDPPEAANPCLRGYFALCFALARARPPVVVQASSITRLAHPGAVIASWRVDQVADLAYGSPALPAPASRDGGCPWRALEDVAAAGADRRRDAVQALTGIPIVRELEDPAELSPALDALRQAACGHGDWTEAVTGARRRLFPGAGDGG